MVLGDLIFGSFWGVSVGSDQVPENSGLGIANKKREEDFKRRYEEHKHQARDSTGADPCSSYTLLGWVLPLPCDSLY